MNRATHFILSIFIALGTLVSCSSNKTQEEESIEVLYFHFTQRCSTCFAIEAETSKDLENLQEKENKEYSFQSINIDDADTKELVKAYNIEGQTLLIIKGDKIVNLTDLAFEYADYHPDKLAKLIEKTINEI